MSWSVGVAGVMAPPFYEVCFLRIARRFSTQENANAFRWNGCFTD